MKTPLLLLVSLICAAGCVPPAPLGTDKALLSFTFDAPPACGQIDQQKHEVSVEVPSATQLSSLVAVFTFTGTGVRVGDAEQESGLTVNDFTQPVAYVVRAEDGSSQTYTVNVLCTRAPRSDKALTAFAIVTPAASGSIDEASHTVTVSVPHGTDLTHLASTFLTTGALVMVQEVPQESGVTLNDFTEPVELVVTAEDGTTQTYLITVATLPSQEKALTRFTFPLSGVVTAMDEEARIVRVRVPADADRSSLIASFETTGVTVLVNGQPQSSGVTINDFTRQVIYSVVAEDGSVLDYAVRVMGRIPLVINELDVDQVGTDTAEFIEIASDAEVDLAGIILVLLNGGVTPGQEYARVDLSRLGIIPADTYVVIAGPNVLVAPGAVRLTPAGWESSNRIQNGPNDAMMLWDSLGKSVIDAVAYNGSLHKALIAGDPTEWDVTEGTVGAPADSNSVSGSLSRTPNCHDSGQNALDFKFTPAMTPGGPNG